MKSSVMMLGAVSAAPGGGVALTGPRDPNVARALDHIHDRPAYGWTLRELARESGTSRSVLAERFHRSVGIPPMQYLAGWRMLMTAMLLSGTPMKLSAIAAQVGYASETALSRAYKRWAGVSPGEWRRGALGGGDSAPAGMVSDDDHATAGRVTSLDCEPLSA